MRFPMVQPVTEMTRATLGARLAPGADEYLDMFHNDAVFEFPFGISGLIFPNGLSAVNVAAVHSVGPSDVIGERGKDAVDVSRFEAVIHAFENVYVAVH